MIKWAAGAQISQVSSLRHSLHYHTEQTHACVESQIPATDISRGTEERWLHPTYIHPTPACLLPTNYTHKHTQSHYRWIHIITVTVQGELQAYYRIIQFQLAVLLLPNLLSICLDFKGRKKKTFTSVKATSDLLVIGRGTFPKAFAQAWMKISFVWWDVKILQAQKH